MKRVVITRALPEALRTAERVRARGAMPIIAPLLNIQARAFDTALNNTQALLFTSAAGVRAFAAATPARSIAALTVGDATAQAARQAGFAQVRAAQGDSDALARLAIATLDPKAGKVIHISGAHVAGDIASQLAAHGFDAERRVAYEAVAAAQLPAELQQPCDIILFHSARAAEIFAGFGAPYAARATAACLSAAVARAAVNSPLGQIMWARVIVSPAPRDEALLDAALAPTDANA
ncbi:MAG: uroporphyrinogen-III synthase [Pseudomonadota bacterium]